MKLRFLLALAIFGLSQGLIQSLSAAQVLVVASNGKWAMEDDGDPNGWNIDAVGAKAIAACKAKGGTDPKIVYRSYKGHSGAIAVSDNGTGNIVGWCFSHPYENGKIAVKDCQRKGGQNPKVVAHF